MLATGVTVLPAPEHSAVATVPDIAASALTGLVAWPDPLTDAVWHVDAGSLTEAGDGLADLSNNGRDAIFGAAPLVLPHDGEDYVAFTDRASGAEGIGEWPVAPAVGETWEFAVDFQIDPPFSQSARSLIWAGGPNRPFVIYMYDSTGTFRFFDADANQNMYTDADAWTPGVRASYVFRANATGVSVERDGEPLWSGDWPTPDDYNGELSPNVLLFGEGAGWASGNLKVYSAALGVAGSPPEWVLDPSRPLADYSGFTNTGTQGGTMRLDRFTDGMKAAVVDRPLLLFGGGQHAEVTAAVQAAEVTVLSAWRVFGSSGQQQTWVDLANGVSGQGRVLTYRSGPATNGTRATAYLTSGSQAATSPGISPWDGPHVFGGRVTRTDVAYVADGAVGPPEAFGAAAPDLWGRAEGVTIGSQWAHTQFTEGEFLAAAIFDRALTDAEVALASEALAGTPRAEDRRVITVEVLEQ